jgi:hypothetical protein
MTEKIEKANTDLEGGEGDIHVLQRLEQLSMTKDK